MKYSTELKLIEKITGTEPQPHRIVLNYFAIFKNVAHTCSLEPVETHSNSVSHQDPNCVHFTTFLNIAKHSEIMTIFQFTGTGTQRFETGNNVIMCSTV